MNALFNPSVIIGLLDVNGQRAMGAMCAESTMAAIDAFATTASKDVCRSGLQLLWSGLHNDMRGVAAELKRSLERLHSLPEASIDDSNVASFQAMAAMGVLAQAIGAVLATQPTEKVVETCLSALSIFGEYDGLLSVGTSRLVGVNNPQTPRAYKILQMTAQLQAVDVLNNANMDWHDKLHRLRKAGEDLANEGSRALVVISRQRMW